MKEEVDGERMRMTAGPKGKVTLLVTLTFSYRCSKGVR